MWRRATRSVSNQLGRASYTVELPVPSGKIVFADDLFDVFEDSETDDLDYNSFEGRKVYAESMIQQGVAYGCILNTSPDVYFDPATKTIHVVSLELDEDTDEFIQPEGWVRLGDICTDLWAYSITDADNYVRNGGSLDDPHITVAEVPAGMYSFAHYADTEGFNHHSGKQVLFASGTHTPLT